MMTFGEEQLDPNLNLISDSYKELLQKVHSDKKRQQGFGGKIKNVGKFLHFYHKWNPTSVLDYGCGKGQILQHFQQQFPNTEWYGYDPAVQEYSVINKNNYECVFCNDVLEHIEPENLSHVLTHIKVLATNYIWLRIDTQPARKFLEDGRNAHLILENKDWWLSKLSSIGNIEYSKLNSKGRLDVAITK